MEKYIYKITNQINNKSYIGQTKNVYRRRQEHFNLTESTLAQEKNKVLYKAMIKYGKENFSFEVIEGPISNYNDQEKYWILYYNTLVPNGYNMTEGGDEPPIYFGENNNASTHMDNTVQLVEQLLLETTLSAKEIGKITNYDYTAVNRINQGIMRHNNKLIYPLRKENTLEYKKTRAKDVINDLLYTELTQKEIGQKYGLSRTAITAINNGANYYDLNLSYPIRKKSVKLRSVQQIDFKTNEVINEFESLNAAAQFLGNESYSANIGACAHERIKTAYGYIWKFKN